MSFIQSKVRLATSYVPYLSSVLRFNICDGKQKEFFQRTTKVIIKVVFS
jgi:hypothetical protein